MSTKYRLNSFPQYAARFATKLPGWHPFRSRPDSNWRKLFTPIFGDVFAELDKLTTDLNKDLFLSTTDTERPDIMYVSPLGAGTVGFPNNLIKNSNFAINTREGYVNWFQSGGVSFQSLYESIRATETLNLRVYGDTIDKVTIIYNRLDTGVEVEDEYTSFGSVIVIDLPYGLEVMGVKIEGAPLFGNKLHLWEGDSNLTWTRHPEDLPYWYEGLPDSSYDLVGDGRPLFECINYYDMYFRMPATYGLFNDTPIPNDTLLTASPNFTDSKVSYYGEDYPMIIDVHQGKIRKTIDRSIEYLYDLYEANLFNDLVPVEYEVLAVYLREDVYIALAYLPDPPLSSSSEGLSSSSSGASSSSSETSSSSSENSSSSSEGLSSSSSEFPNHRFYLLWVSPECPSPEDGILNIVKSLPIDMPFDFTGTFSLFTRTNNPFSIVVNTAGSFYEIDLKYDYFVADLINGEYTYREPYETMIGAEQYQPLPTNFFNALDDHGLIRGLSRLRLERNYDYKQRLMDYSSVHKTNASFIGVSNGVNIRFGQQILDNVLEFPDNLHVVKNDDYFYIADPDAVVVVTLNRDANYDKVVLSDVPFMVHSVKVDGKLWPTSLYKVRASSHEVVFSKYPTIDEAAIIQVSYCPYKLVVNTNKKSIQDLRELIDLAGITVTTDYLAETLDALHAAHIGDLSESGTGISLTYYPIRIDDLRLYELSAFQDLSITNYSLSLIQTKVLDLIKTMHTTWDTTKLDYDRWDMVSENQLGGGILPAYNDGIYSWLESGGSFYGHKSPPITYNKKGFSLDQLQNGVNTTKLPLEIHKDLNVIGFTSDYKPKVTPGFFYIKEMKFYLYADKHKVELSTTLGRLIDMDELKADNPTVEYYEIIGCTPFYDDFGGVYVLDTEMATAQVTGIDTIDNSPVTTDLDDYELSGVDYYLIEPFKEGAPLIMTDHGSGKQEVQFSAEPSGLVKLLDDSYVTSGLYLEYEPADAPDYSILDVSAKYLRGYLYIELTDTFTESLVDGTNYALVNGPRKGKSRVIFDPDITDHPGLDYSPGTIVETTNNSTIPNPNLYYSIPVGYGHNWGIDFGN